MSILAAGRAPYTWEDLESIGDDGTGNRYEIVDGGLAVSPPSGFDHDRAAGYLLRQLMFAAPDWALPLGPLGINLGEGSCRIPDLVIVRAGIPSRPGPVESHEVLLAVEVESPGTRTADRITKPAEYAAAGIPSYWRLLVRDVVPTLLVYELTADGVYEETGRAEGEEELAVQQPFPVMIRPADLVR